MLLLLAQPRKSCEAKLELVCILFTQSFRRSRSSVRRQLHMLKVPCKIQGVLWSHYTFACLLQLCPSSDSIEYAKSVEYLKRTSQSSRSFPRKASPEQGTLHFSICLFRKSYIQIVISDNHELPRFIRPFITSTH